MIGTSYEGTLPLAAATTGVKGLEVVIPVSPNTSYYHYYRSNGLVRSPGGYLGEDVDVLYDFIASGDSTDRDNCDRIWKNGSPNAGFTTGIPWLPVPVTYQTHNVEAEKKDPNSILNFYKNLLALRHTNPALLEGDYIAVNQDDTNVYSYLRRYKGQAVLVVLNMSENPQKVSFDLAKQGFSKGEAKTLLSTINGGATQKLSGISLPPYTVYIGEVTK
jgi:glycosidase